MRKLALCLILFCAASPVLAQVGGARPKIAVYVAGDAAGELKALSAIMLEGFVNSGRYTAVERSGEFLQQIDNEQARQRSGAVDNEQISRLGKQSGVDFICVIAATKVYGEHQLSARMIDVETATVVAITSTTGFMRSMADLTRAGNILTDRLLPSRAVMQQHPQALPGPPQQAQPQSAQPHAADNQSPYASQQQQPAATGASIFIATLPSHADVYIGDNFIGKTNDGELQVPIGTYQMRFVKGSVEHTESMTFQPGKNHTKFIPLNSSGKKRKKQADSQPAPASPIQQQAYDQVQFQTYSHSARDAYGSFTTGERWGTWALNWLIPSVGSFTIMKDRVGGWTQIGIVTCYSGSLVAAVMTEEPALIYVALGLSISQFVYNIYRSATYGKPKTRATLSENGGTDFYFAVFPDEKGDLKIAALYSLEF